MVIPPLAVFIIVSVGPQAIVFLLQS